MRKDELIIDRYYWIRGEEKRTDRDEYLTSVMLWNGKEFTNNDFWMKFHPEWHYELIEEPSWKRNNTGVTDNV